MANEIGTATATGRTLYAVVRNAAGQLWYTVTPAFEAYNAAHWTAYALALSEQGASGYYTASFPGAITTPGRYSIDVRQQLGGSPATSDPVVAGGSLVWSGTAEAFVTADGAGHVTLGAYAAGQDPAALLLSAPANKLLTNASGQVDVDWSQAIPTTASGLTAGRAALAAIAEGVGVWKYDPVAKTLVEYAEDGVTVLRSFALTIDTAGTITQRA